MPGTLSPVVPQSEQSRILGGTDIAQLLRDIGEASATTDPLELFRLCLNAQRALTDVQSDGALAMTPLEAALLAPFRDMHREGQDRLVSFARRLQERFPRLRAALTLVKATSTQNAEAV